MKWAPSQIVSHEQQAELLSLWQEGRMTDIRRIEDKLRLNRKYTAKLAYRRGVKRPKHISEDFNDPRWQWAIDRGPVVA